MLNTTERQPDKVHKYIKLQSLRYDCPTNFLTSMITYCLLRQHQPDSRSEDGSKGCRNANNRYRLHIDEFI